MTLPFRRRHHDDEASHDRARALISASFLGPLGDPDQAWLDGHLGRCPECRADREGYIADRAMLQALRDTPPVPPRDLWARTAAAIQQEAASRSRRGFLDRVLGPAPRGIPLGPVAGIAVAAVVVAVAVWPRAGIAPASTATPPTVANGQPTPGPTTIDVDNQVAFVQPDDNGHYTLVFADISQVCPSGDQPCAPLPTGNPTRVQLNAPPQAVVLAPDNGQVAVVGSEADGSVVIVDVPTPAPSGPSVTPTTPSAAPATQAPPTVAPSVPLESAAGSPLPSASPPAVPNGHAIIHDVVVVGAPAYSEDGTWFAFSARPRDRSAGPDLYAWHVGDESAIRLTQDGQTYFAGWFQNRIVASSLRPSPAPDASAMPAASLPDASAAPSPETTQPAELQPYSFLLDPVSGTRSEFAQDDVWLPSIDPNGRFVAYWSGTVVQAADGDGIQPATGALVLDGWSEPLASAEAGPSDAPSATATEPTTDASAPITPSGVPASSGPLPSSAAADGPAGTPVVLVAGPVGDVDVRFDPTGTRLVVWTADPGTPDVGPLWLLVLDPVAGGPNATVGSPLPAPGVAALRGFALDDGRLGWVTPPGQNGQPSSISILAWKGDAFGQVQTVPGRNPQIVR